MRNSILTWMHMRNLFLSFIALILIVSCSDQKKVSTPEVNFTIRQLPLKTDTTITVIAFLNNNLICLQSNNQLAIFDSTYTRQSLLENKLKPYKFNYLSSWHDTLFLFAKNKAYFIDKEFEIKPFSRETRTYGDRLYEDSVYYVYGCCAGEFGGSVFFLNKQNNKTYSYFATCATQVLQFKNEYLVCNNLAHLGFSMSYLFIPDPDKLYELKEDSLKNHCNWYAGVDSLKDYWGKSDVGNTRFYSGPYNSMSLISFAFKDSLYSVISNDSSTYIGVHRGDTILPRQIILNKMLPFHESQIITAWKKKICLFNLTSGSPFAAYTVRGNSSGLLIVDGNKIDILYKQ